MVADDGNGVDEAIADYCVKTLSRFDELLQDAICLIAGELKLSEADVTGRFRPTDLWGFSLLKAKRHFYLSFADAHDEFRLWRVQFDDDKAAYVGFDS